MSGAASRMSRIGPMTCSSHCDCQSWSLSSSSERTKLVPALLTSASTVPKRSTQAATIAAASSGFVTSAWNVSSPVRATSSTCAPSACSISAVARPMPRVAPVTMQALPVSPRSIA